MHWNVNVTRWRRHSREARNGRGIVVELLVRPGCRLCDDAHRALLTAFDPADIATIDITDAADSSLEDEYVFRIPVIRYADHVLAEGVVSTRDARRIKRTARALRSGGTHG